ncbi:MAG: trigger factor, partial [Marinirhabdus sp.]
KQYGKAVLVDEVNKILQDSLHRYLTDEKLELLGNPLPKNEDKIDWDGKDFSFSFDLGLSPQFDVNIKAKPVAHYKIMVDEKTLDKQVDTIRKQYGKLISKNEVGAGNEITGTFTSTEKEIENKTTFSIESISGKKQLKTLIGAKVGDTLTLKTKKMFKGAYQNQQHFGVTRDSAKGLDTEVTLNIEEVNKREPAELNQELFDKLFGKGNVTSGAQLREKIKESTEKQFERQSDQNLLDSTIEMLIANTKFDLPKEFLTRWIQRSAEGDMTAEEAKAEYERGENGLRYQLIEGKLRAENPQIQVTYDALKDHAKNVVKAQMAQFGQINPTDAEIEPIAMQMLSNKEGTKRITEQLTTQKLLVFFKENAKLKTKEVTHE